MRTLRWLAATITALLLFPTFSAFAGTITVDTLTDGIGVAGCSLREAISQANLGSDGEDCTGVTASPNTIVLSVSGSYTLTTGSQLSVTSNVTIQEGSGITAVIEAATMPQTAGYRVFNVSGGTPVLTLDGITVRNGGTSATALNGGCISVSSGSLFLTNGTVVEDCHVFGDGGGISATTSTVSITDSTVRNNSATDAFADGGGIRTGSLSSLTLLRATIHNNTAIATTSQAIGGGVNYTGSTLSITDSIISANTAQGNGASTTTFGGGLWVSGSGTVTGTTFSGNRAILAGGNLGGAVRKTGTGTLDFSSSIFTSNTVSGGNNTGAVFNVGSGTLNVTSSRIEGNGSAAATSAAVLAISSTSTASITGSCIVNNIDTADLAINDIDASIITTATNNWWGTSWGPRIAGAGGGSAVSNGDSISGSGTSAVDVGLISPGTSIVAPTGNWQTTAPMVAGATCLTCTGVSSISHARICS